jgi:hypothetical protein
MEKNRKQVIKFETQATKNPDEAVGHARYVINARKGIGMNVLEKIVEEHIPFVNHKEVQTDKTIIRTDRYECPCCPTDLSALVRVSCQGLVTDEWEKVKGLYRIDITPDHGACKVTVEKLSGEKIYQGRVDYLPRKDYEANPKSKKEIEDRNEFFNELAKENPGKVFFADGIETAEDLGNLVGSAIEKFSEK